MFRLTYISADAPTVNDDYDSGFRNGNLWLRTSNNALYVLEDASAGAADWVIPVNANVVQWADWTPTFTWGSNDPSGVTYVARYMLSNSTVFFYVQINGTADGDCTDLSFTLPATPDDTNAYVPVVTWYIDGGSVGKDNIAYINSDDAVTRDLDHARFQTISNGSAFKLFFQGFYETTV